MDIDMERKIAKAFIYRSKQQRFLYERSKKQRLDSVFKLPSIIDKSLALMNSKHFPAAAELIRIMQTNNVHDMCYVISEYQNEGFDGEYVSLDKAVKKLQFNGFSSLIVGLPSGFSHFKEESYTSMQPNCFLKPLHRFDGIPWSN